MVILITGGTGSWGQCATKKLLAQGHTIRIFSRDELKQDEMRKKVSGNVRFLIGDVRDLPRVESAMKGVDIVFHAAALKQVPSCEYNPYEAVKTNIIGTQNVISAAADSGVSKCVLISTDKAVAPINLYGATKLVAEKIWLAANQFTNTRFAVSRYGNVAGSRGSVIPLFEKQSQEGKMTITDPAMTRFLITLDDAVDFVLSRAETMVGGEIFIPDMKSCRIMDLAEAISETAHKEITGIRPGEKLHETLGDNYFSNDPHRLMSDEETKEWYEQYKFSPSN